MSSRMPWPMASTTPQIVEICGSFAPDTANAPTDVRGDGFTVARTNTGEFTIAWDKYYPELESFTGSLQLATKSDQFLVCGAVDLTAKTAVMTVWDISGAAAADVAAAANNRVNFRLAFKNTTL